jgi:hypothetical protein
MTRKRRTTAQSEMAGTFDRHHPADCSALLVYLSTRSRHVLSNIGGVKKAPRSTLIFLGKLGDHINRSEGPDKGRVGVTRTLSWAGGNWHRSVSGRSRPLPGAPGRNRSEVLRVFAHPPILFGSLHALWSRSRRRSSERESRAYSSRVAISRSLPQRGTRITLPA